MFNKIFILNPAYFLRNDVYRAIIGTFDFPSMPPDLYEKNYLKRIHPLNAQMISFFNGKRNLAECIDLISDYFELPCDVVSDILINYINNPEELCIKNGDDYILFPKNVLIEKSNYERTEYYEPDDFKIEGPVDLKTIRLYKPVKIIIETNLNCYTDCIYCYADKCHPKAKDILPISKMLSLIQEIKDLKIPSIEINGGEVLIHPQAKELLSELTKLGYTPFISTKIPLSKEYLDFLRSIQVTHIQISIDSINEKTLKTLLNVKKGYFEKIVETMSYLDNNKFDWQVNIVITRHNTSINTEILPLFEFLTKFKNLKVIKVSPMAFSMYKSIETNSKNKASLKTIHKIAELMDTFAIRYRNIEFVYAQPDCYTEYSRDYRLANFGTRSICSANQRGFVVLPNGEVTICEELYWNPHFIIGDIRKQTVMQIWNSEKAKKLFFIQQETMSEESACKSCDKFDICRHSLGICWKMVMIAYGANHYDFPDPRCPYAPKPDVEFYYK